MSYDIWLEADLGGPETVTVGSLDWNYTYNVQPMTAKAGLRSLNDLDGTAAEDAAARIANVIAAMEADPAGYRALNPENGWGSYDTFLPALRELYAAFRDAPRAKVRVC